MAKEKLTREKLRRIIREEKAKLDEIGAEGGEWVMPDAIDKATRKVENAQSLYGQFMGQNAMDPRDPTTRGPGDRVGQKAEKVNRQLRKAVDALYEMKEAIEQSNQAK